MINNPKVSIILPSLNVGMYIRQCMDSVVNQTLRDVEIICVDAGSTDGTLEILREFEQRDNRIKVIVSDRKSYGYQMNLGLDAATGDYIGIVETDDWIEPDMFDTLWRAASQNDADLVKSNYFWYYTQPKKIDKPFENLAKCNYNTIFSPEQDQRIFSTTPAIWSGIYRKDMLTQYHIRFNETPGASYQDTSFHFMTCTAADRAYLLDSYHLHYRRDNENSSVNTDGKIFCVSDEMHYYERFLDLYPQKKEKLYRPFLAWKYEKYRWNYERIAPALQWRFLSLFRDEFKEYRERSLLGPDIFSNAQTEKINLLIDRPFMFFEEYGKIYATRPKGKDLPAEEYVCISKVEHPLVSVVIPGFNSEKFIQRGIDSILHQTCNSFEIVCVDDGSLDKTLSIMVEAAKYDERITVLHQVNKGLSAARNAGMRAAKGKFILFLDADDELRQDAVSLLIEEAEKRGTDILCFDAQSIYASEELQLKHPYYKDAYSYDLDLQDAITGTDYFNRAKEDGKYRASACMALYDLEFLRSNQIEFIDGIYQEDNLFTFTCLMHAKKAWHTTERLYKRYVHEDSIMTQNISFLHLYGYLTSAIQMMTFAYSMPYEQRLYCNIKNEVDNLIWHTRNTYQSYENKEKAKAKLTEIEKLYLDCFVVEPGDNKELIRIRNSYSYKIGRMLTAPARKLYNLVHSIRKNGLRLTLIKYYKGLFGGKPQGIKPLFISSDAYKMSGAFLSLLALNKELNQQLHLPTEVILPYWGSGNELAKEAGVKNRVISSTDWIVPIDTHKDLLFYAKKYNEHTENIYASVRIARIALKENYSVIHSNSTYTYVGYLASRIANVPHVWHLREFLEEDQGKSIYCKKRGYRMLARSDRVVTISQALYQKYASIVPDSKLRMIYNGVDSEKYYLPNHTVFNTDIPVFLFVSGSAAPEKGRKTLIDACAILKQCGVRFSLRFVGWCGTELQQLVEKAGILEETEFFGYQKDTEQFYKSADIFFMCSQFEAFGRTTVEAMMAGCVVIGANTAGTKELIKDLETGFLYQYGDETELVGKIKSVLSDKELARKIAKNGQEDMYTRFSATANATAVSELYQEMSPIVKTKGKIGKWVRLRYADMIALYCKLRRHTVGKLCKWIIASKRNNSKQVAQMSKGVEGPAVSVIVPIYNEECFLRQCLDSIIKQTLKEIEIICVNDGSTDTSGQILAEYAKLDNRIVVINKQNSGYGASVNQGIQAANGKYIAIVESDDFIDPAMLNNLYSLAIERGCVDIIKSSYWMYYDTEDGKGERREAPILSACHPPKEVFDVWTYPEIIYHHPSIWSCLYRREFLKEKKICFVEAKGAGWVDNPFLLETFCQANTITWTPESYYNYRQTNPNASSFIKDCSMPFVRTGEMLRFLDKKGIMDSDIRGSVYKRILWNAASVQKNPFYSAEKDRKLIIDQMKEIPVSFLENRHVTDKERETYKMLMTGEETSGSI